MADQSSPLAEKAKGGFLQDLGSMVSNLASGATDSVRQALFIPEVNQAVQEHMQRDGAFEAEHPTLSKALDIGQEIADGVNTATSAGGVPALHAGSLFGLSHEGAMFHGTRTAESLEAILRKGFRSGKSYELGLPGVSVTRDPALASYFTAEDPLRLGINPDRVLAVDIPEDVSKRLMNVNPTSYEILRQGLDPSFKKVIKSEMAKGGITGLNIPNSLLIQHETLLSPRVAESLTPRTLNEGERAELGGALENLAANKAKKMDFLSGATPENTIDYLKSFETLPRALRRPRLKTIWKDLDTKFNPDYYKAPRDEGFESLTNDNPELRERLSDIKDASLTLSNEARSQFDLPYNPDNATKLHRQSILKESYLRSLLQNLPSASNLR